MTLKELRESLKLWEERESRFYRNWREYVEKGSKSPRRAFWYQEYKHARFTVARRRAQLREREPNEPRIITAADLGLTFQYVWGKKGTPTKGAGHYTAGPKAKNATELIEEARRDHRLHKDKGWGGLSYEALVADDGTIFLGNPMDRLSAAVASNNTGMANICHPGTTGHRITEDAEKSIRWLLDNWHTTKIPKRHRMPRKARSFRWKGHKEYPNNATACPGNMLSDYHRIF